jgi:hypothetical protein
MSASGATRTSAFGRSGRSEVGAAVLTSRSPRLLPGEGSSAAYDGLGRRPKWRVAWGAHPQPRHPNDLASVPSALISKHRATSQRLGSGLADHIRPHCAPRLSQREACGYTGAVAQQIQGEGSMNAQDYNVVIDRRAARVPNLRVGRVSMSASRYAARTRNDRRLLRGSPKSSGKRSGGRRKTAVRCSGRGDGCWRSRRRLDSGSSRLFRHAATRRRTCW